MDHMPYLDGLTHVQLIQMMTDCCSKMNVEGNLMVQSSEEKKMIALTSELKEVKGALALSKPLVETLKAGNQTGERKEQKNNKKNKKPKEKKREEKGN